MINLNSGKFSFFKFHVQFLTHGYEDHHAYYLLKAFRGLLFLFRSVICLKTIFVTRVKQRPNLFLHM